jgi:PAS domain S-box-containing protein
MKDDSLNERHQRLLLAQSSPANRPSTGRGRALGTETRLKAGSKLKDSELHDEQAGNRDVFEGARVALWDQDFSAVCAWLNDLRAQGVTDLRAHFSSRPDELEKAIGLIRVRNVNHYAVELFEAESKEALIGAVGDTMVAETRPVLLDELVALAEGRKEFEGEAVLRTLKGRRITVARTISWGGAQCDQSLVSILDISKQKASERRFEALTRVGRMLSSDFDLERIVQALTDSATELSGARFGAFFYNVTDEKGERYVLYTLSGAPREAFEGFGLPRNTAIFDPTFRGTGIVRSDDITADPRYGRSAPHYGMPKGHLPVVSYLAVPVISRSGAVHGGLFLGHEQKGVFTRDVENTIAALAAHAAVSLDNANLMQSAQREVETRRQTEEAARTLAAIVESSDDAIVSKDLNGIVRSWNAGAERIFGWSAEEMIGQPITTIIPADRWDEEPGILARIRQGERVDHFETVRVKKDGGLIDISLTVSPVLGPDGQITGASKIARDITDRKKMEKQRELLMAELSHRVKNTLATVISIERLSFADHDDMEEARRSFISRIQALSHAHGRLAESHWSSAPLEDVIEDELAPYLNTQTRNGVLAGPDVKISARCVLSLGLAIHELATNAAKYGALSSEQGRVDVTWRLRPEDRALELNWIESGGPPVRAASRKGFGRMLLERALAQELGCTVKLDYALEGFRCSILIPPQEYQTCLS